MPIKNFKNLGTNAGKGTGTGVSAVRSILEDMLDGGQEAGAKAPDVDDLLGVIFGLLDHFKFSLKQKVDIYTRLGYTEQEVIDIVSGKAYVGSHNVVEYFPEPGDPRNIPQPVGGSERK